MRWTISPEFQSHSDPIKTNVNLAFYFVQTLFQSHSDPIKTWRRKALCVTDVPAFQSHSDPIKTVIFFDQLININLFQSHSDPIKTGVPVVITPFVPRFNPTLIRLKLHIQETRL